MTVENSNFEGSGPGLKWSTSRSKGMKDSFKVACKVALLSTFLKV